MEWIAPIGYTALGVLVLAWLVVSFSAPGRRRAVVEWLGASAMYVALLSLFGHLLSRALAQQSTVAAVAFGFLLAFFGVGLVLCLVQTASSLRGEKQSASSATN